MLWFPEPRNEAHETLVSGHQKSSIFESFAGSKKLRFLHASHFL
jgi:hypothetical protein